MALIPVLAWIGLGADGVSSSSYGPQEAFRALGTHTYLVCFLALGTAVTVFVISYAYSRIIEHFPGGGGGYIVVTHTVGDKAGVVAGSALLVDYMLTIAVSIAACADAVFSFIPAGLHMYKLLFAIFLVIFLILLNLRGVKESVLILAPIFLTFIIFHILLLGYGLLSQGTQFVPMVSVFQDNLTADISAIGIIGVLAIVLRSYSLGAGTYTGIEAVANGLPIMREPRVRTGKRTMIYMAVSLAAISAALLFCFFLWQVQPVEGQTLNAVLATKVFGGWPFGSWIALVTILSEGVLLMVGAQTGFLDGPRVMANMAIDSWLPRRFSSLSERFVMNDGILLMGGAAILLLIFTQASITALVVMYAINVFLNFTLAEFGMSRFFYTNRNREPLWRKHILIHLVGLVLCSTILAITIFEKFGEGGWITLFVTSGVIGVCYLIHGHYQTVNEGFHKFDDLLTNCPSLSRPEEAIPVNPKRKTAVQLVSSFNGFGIHTFFSIIQNFPDQYENFIFVSIAVVDSGSFKGVAEVTGLHESVRESCEKYVDLARCLGFAAECRTAVGTDVVETGVDLCTGIAAEFRNSTFFTGQIIFRNEHPFHRILHNETAFAIQRRLHYRGITTVILPVRAGK
ncbi:MAG: APC family permease [Methanoregulaceae archaeon]|nr:APC family permease [Methanoregulaceae archaeon]